MDQTTIEKVYTNSNLEKAAQELVNNLEPEETCLLDEAFKREQEKPAHLRNNAFAISCPCKKCNPGKL